MSTTEIELIEPEARAAGVADRRQSSALVETSPAALVRMAVQQGADLDRLERLMAMQERWEANEAKKAFTQAMTAFKAEPIVILKKKQVSFTTRDGDTTSYKHAELSDVTEAICPMLSKHGLSHRWDTKQTDGKIIVTCIVTHAAGHAESITMEAPPDTSGKKNPIQQIASAVQYLQRYTLLAITGTSTKGEDDDGRAAGDVAVAVVSEKILDGLVVKLEHVSTDAEALALWKIGRDSLEATANVEALNEFRALVEKKRGALKAGGTAK